MATVGGVVSAPVPVTLCEMVLPSAVKSTLAFAVVAVVGVKRTVTVWLPPTPRVNELPETMLKGAGTDAVPETLRAGS
jgi:hypothetical protein